MTKNRITEGNSLDRKRELDNCTFVRTVLILAVVLYHSISFWSSSWFRVATPEYMSPFLSVINTLITHFMLYGFVLISGYIFAFAFLEKKSYQRFGPFIKNKALRLLVPFYFVGVFWAIPFGIWFYEYDFSTAFKQVILASSPQQLWFLWMLFGVFALFWLIRRVFTDKPWYWGAAICLVFYVAGLAIQGFTPNYLQVGKMLQFVVFFWTGFQIRREWGRKIRSIRCVYWIAGYLVLILILRLVDAHSGMIFKMLQAGVTLVLHFIGAIMIFTVLQRMAERVRWHESKWFMCLAKNSMGIFLFHQQIICTVILVLNYKIDPHLIAVIAFILSLTVAWLLSAFLHKFKVTRFLIGEK